MDKMVNTSLRMESDLYGKLAEIAKLEGRSINQQVVYFIRKNVDQPNEMVAQKPIESTCGN